jgi:hypothetical protein
MAMPRSVAFIGALVLLAGTVLGGSAQAKTSGGAPPVSFARADLTSGAHDRVSVASGALQLASGVSGSWTSTWRTTPFAFDELVVSWNATTPAGTWIQVDMQASGSGRETKWYVMGIWASGDGDIQRTSVGGQRDTDGTIAIDTFIRDKKAAALDAYRLRVSLHRAAEGGASPAVRFVGAMVSAATRYEIPSPWGGAGAVDLAVPMYSQEIHAGHFPEYDNGGEAWCSPTSTAMVLAYWGTGPSADDLAAFPGSGHFDGEVDYAARYVYDYHYQGAGNWPFNTAYAATFGLEGFVTRLRSLNEAELFIRAGIPLVASINGKLPGFLFGKTSGHLLVIRGFTASGDVVTNDPAVMSDAEVRKVYGRADFESVWLEGSAGIVYVIHPTAVPLPANVAGAPANW